MSSHLLIAVDAFGDGQCQVLADALDGWGTWEKLAEEASPNAIANRLATADIAIGWIEADLLIKSSVRLMMCPSVGYEPYLNHGLEDKPGFTFCNAGDVYASGLAQHMLAMMLALVRRLPQYVRAMQSQTWQHMSTHEELAGKTVCIVGLGNMGREIVRLCAAFNMNVIGVRRSTTRQIPDGVARVYPTAQLREAVAQADHVIAALPGGQSTAGLFDERIFSAMKPGAYFYNMGRGSTVDESSLIAFLESGHLGGAGLDVFAAEPLPAGSPLWMMDNVIITPHMAGHTADYADRLVGMFAENLRRYHLNQPLLNVIDLKRGYL